MGLYEQLKNQGAISGKQMKALNAFTTNSNGSYFSTPFFCGDSLLATDTFTSIRIKKSVAQQQYFPNEVDYAFKIPESVLKKTLVTDVYCFSDLTGELEIWKYPKGKDSERTAMSTDKNLKVTGDKIISMFDNPGKILSVEEVEALHICGFNPKYMKKVCDLMEAFNISCFDFHYHEMGNMAVIMVVCPSNPEVSAIICPMRHKE